nr:galactosylceramide sulfotransferase-like [Rhipicephalus microplus]
MTCRANDYKALLKNSLRKWDLRKWAVFLVLLLMLVSLHMYGVQQYSLATRAVWYKRFLTNRTRFSNDCRGCCRPALNVFLLKTHKCAGSTVQNVLMRFGDRRNLSFALPREGNYFGHPKPFSLSMIPADMIPPWGFNIFCHHVRFGSDDLRRLMPPDTVFITILRDPARLFESLYLYYHLENHTGVSLEAFLKSDTKQRWLDTHRYAARFGRNQMLFDLGMDTSGHTNDSEVDAFIQHIEDSFRLVLIAELFDESLILLRDLLCWDTQPGIVRSIFLFTSPRTLCTSSTTNACKRRLAGSGGINDADKGNSALRHQMERYNMGDGRLYRHFRQKMERLIDEYGRKRMRQEVDGLKLWKSLLYEHCVEKLDSGRTVAYETREYSDDVYSIVLRSGVNNRLCLDMARA